MKLIQRLSFSSARYLADNLGEDHEKRRMYYFGFQVVYGAVIKSAILIALSSLSGALWATLTVVAVFALLRAIAGGYHMDTYGKCIAVSICLFLIAGCVAQYTYMYWNNTGTTILILTSFILAMASMLKWSPKDSPNRPITSAEEKRRFKALSALYVFVWLIGASLLNYCGNTLFVLSASFGLLLGAFIITPPAYRLFDILSGKLDKLSG
ncbi:MAG: accessory gene regulator B family protein [Clostridia bacterium]|nr:accessory gene regulator B family protein [Clostridia bacterium]